MGTGSGPEDPYGRPVSFVLSLNTGKCEDIKEGTILAGKVHKTLQSKNLIN